MWECRSKQAAVFLLLKRGTIRKGWAECPISSTLIFLFLVVKDISTGCQWSAWNLNSAVNIKNMGKSICSAIWTKTRLWISTAQFWLPKSDNWDRGRSQCPCINFAVEEVLIPRSEAQWVIELLMNLTLAKIFFSSWSGIWMWNDSLILTG